MRTGKKALTQLQRLKLKNAHVVGNCDGNSAAVKFAGCRMFHDLPRRHVMEECAKNVTDRPEIQAVFTKVMTSTPEVSSIYHRNGLGQLVEGNGEMITVNESVSGILLANGKSATAKDVEGWISQLTPRENRHLENGIDIKFLNELLAALEILKTHPKIVHVCKSMADECHKPAPSIDVEVGEFLYGLGDTFKIIKEAHSKGMVADPANLTTFSGRKATHVVGGHPSNFVVYFSPSLEAIALGWPSVLLNHPQVPTAASKFIALLEEAGVDFKGKLVQAVVSNIDELCAVFHGPSTSISQGILIAGLNMGKVISKVAPNTKQELSGSNELVCTAEQYRQHPEAFIDSLKVNLGYSAGKQCTAPSKVIFVGFQPQEVAGLQTSLQAWSDASTSKPARFMSDFTSHLPYLFNNDQGNIGQFTDPAVPGSYSPFVTGPRALFTQNDSSLAVQEVFGPATAVQFVESLDAVSLSQHSLSMGINIDIASDGGRHALREFLQSKDFKYLPCIINIGFGASTLAATPTGEAFLPWQFTLSGQDSGMGPHSPLRYCSFQVSPSSMDSNAAKHGDGTLGSICDTAVRGMKAHPTVFMEGSSLSSAQMKTIMLSNAAVSDRSLQPTLNARLTDDTGENVKVTLYMPMKIDEATYIRLSREDTPPIRRSMVAYALQLARQGVAVNISASREVMAEQAAIEDPMHLLSSFRAALSASGVAEYVTVEPSSDEAFIVALSQKPHTVLVSDEDFKIRLKRENHFLTVFVSTQHTPFAVVGVKPQTVKVAGTLENCLETLTGIIADFKDRAPVHVTDDLVRAQVDAVKAQVSTLQKKLVMAQYAKYATPHYKDKVQVIAANTKGIRVTEEDGDFFFDCNMAYGAAKAGYTPDVSPPTFGNGKPLSPSTTVCCADHMPILPSQAMYTKELAHSLMVLSKRYGPLINKPVMGEVRGEAGAGGYAEVGASDDIQVCLLNSGGEIMDSIQQAARRVLGDNAVIIYPRGNFNGRRDHANKLNQKQPLPSAFDNHGELVVDMMGRCFTEFNDPVELEAVVHACRRLRRKAAIIWEPVQGEGGVHVTSADYAAKLTELQAMGELLIVADEVQTGFSAPSSSAGMVSGYLGVKPDMLALAKSLTLGRVAASACVLTRTLAMSAFPPGTDGGTFSGSPTACYWLVTADEFWHGKKGEENSLDKLFELGNRRLSALNAALQERPNRFVKEVRGLGPMGAVHFNSAAAAKHYHDLMLDLTPHLQASADPSDIMPAPALPIGFRGIIQKLSGKSSEVMRLTAALNNHASGGDHEQETLTQLLMHVLTNPAYYPQGAAGGGAR
jgi:acetylornithine/succinyldiaminopimelate/putrescine aminotransferase